MIKGGNQSSAIFLNTLKKYFQFLYLSLKTLICFIKILVFWSISFCFLNSLNLFIIVPFSFFLMKIRYLNPVTMTHYIESNCISHFRQRQKL